MPALCRDCLARFDGAAAPPRRCPGCGSPRILSHPELWSLEIAHVDCDAFYASVEKRDDPSLRDRPVIVGGGRRGVVSTACYLARLRGVRSAMPMFEARRLCPDAVVISPRFDAYAAVSRAIRDRMEALTDRVEPLSLDEAFLDLRGTTRLHGAPAAVLLARLTREIERDLGLTASVGLSYNKFLAKIASDLDKPRGFSVLGRSDAPGFLARQEVGLLWGIGAAGQAALAQAGIHRIGDLLHRDRQALRARFGVAGERLWHLARGEDDRPVCPERDPRCLSNETTFPEDIADRDALAGHLWRLSEKVSARAKARAVAGRLVLLRLKRADHSLLVRRSALREPTQLAERLYRAARILLDQVADPGPFRLIGVGLAEIAPAAQADRDRDLLDPLAARHEAAERAADAIRARFGQGAILKGRALR
ncbi:Nucleotidyltransferase/DNA polymerase involved in DNA repair [Rubellimicrobium thermophilum DSM 16684]|uniref:DNA polymerase IV n=1 Tax=Rubellimicrobium thermophilum DSM 16684 TaxID=1123069 RepID=S9QRW2_9RHOB|nr:DNA polymerase IV [Rubellimicrobium thermophilum]EPX82398.1 Nucleotidyltransferase/DNA polymerase involved in DNA repair [Rubellimicrobium thermophilum DSM 16684]